MGSEVKGKGQRDAFSERPVRRRVVASRRRCRSRSRERDIRMEHSLRIGKYVRGARIVSAVARSAVSRMRHSLSWDGVICGAICFTSFAHSERMVLL